MTTPLRQDCLLDTGVANLIARSDPIALQRLAMYQRSLVPDIVVGELYYGAYYHAAIHKSTKFLDLYDDFLRLYRGQLLHTDENTAIIYATIAAELRTKGQTIQQNDMWIAALARQYGLTLVTVDGDFKRVPNLMLDVW